MRPLFLSLVPALVAAAPAAAQPGSLDQVSAHLRGISTMTADFVQTDRTGKALSGTLTLRQPGKIRFQYQQGVPLLIVGDGKALTMIDYSVKQVSRWPVGNSPLSVLIDPRKDMSRFAHIVPSAIPGTVAVEARDPKHPEFGTITILFARGGGPGGLVLQGWTVLDAQNGRATVRLSNQRFGVPISDKAFIWNDPRPRGPRK
ncbi:LolA family protein [Rhizorhabdus dicambivorans]|uniref:Outer membrane lipoprotein carrier protein LolA n=1 Tax=Rhizorhabdus dicambivorans TaxID=1850238 RepID=A0A2A4FSH4_9SPHN|nr:outer membrane lipoprotein carrier protein LolA [Rhizorhabdus dicambivorans]ATE63571.1 outer membrane lipoprotein carrier protein LolA [Rhizorhabdus dicambivorans]PCE41373.1 outer membrane lipoprotein carrier protein LolA [Rhizorhabdus dicambivorans]